MKKQQYKRIITFLNDPKLTKLEKLRLVLLFTLRYEGDPKATELLAILRD